MRGDQCRGAGFDGGPFLAGAGAAVAGTWVRLVYIWHWVGCVDTHHTHIHLFIHTQVIKVQLLASVSLRETPELVRLLEARQYLCTDVYMYIYVQHT